jgi:hypothetical protein
MSFSFYIACDSPIKTADLIKDTQAGHIVCTELKLDPHHIGKMLSNLLKRNTPFTGIRHFYIKDVTCRSVEIAYEESGYRVRIMSCSAPEDYELAFSLVESIAYLKKKTTVLTEQDEMLNVAELRQKFDRAWVDGEIQSAFEMVLRTAEKNVISLEGATRQFYVGPRLVSELLALESNERRLETFFQTQRHVQHLNTDGYYSANTMLVGNPPRPMTSWTANLPYFFPWVTHFSVITMQSPKDLFIAPADKLLEIVGDKVTWLDEKQTLVKAIPKDEWPAFVASAREFAVDMADFKKR